MLVAPLAVMPRLVEPRGSPVRKTLSALLSIWSLVLLSGCASLSAVTQLKDGTYECLAVFVNQSNKYEIYADDEGRRLTGYARIQDGEVTSYSAPNALGWRSGVALTVRKSGSSHFHATQDPAMHSYDALACDWSEA